MYVGVFGFINNAIIKNLGVTGSVRGEALVTSGNYPNGNLWIHVTDCYAGGICGRASSSTIFNCYNTGNISGQSGGSLYSCGICGIVGDNVNIINCFTANSTIVAPKAQAWRIAGEGANINGCYALSSMKINGSTRSSQDPTGRDGKNASLPNFRSQSWITQKLAWNFNEILTNDEPLHNIRYLDLQGRVLPKALIGQVFIESGENSHGKIVLHKKFINN
jgi:hypothetical protein